MLPVIIQEMLDHEPFEPFRVLLSNGSSYDVRNPHMVALLKTRMFVAAADSEKWAFVSYLHITAVETIGNGQHRRRGRRKPRS